MLTVKKVRELIKDLPDDALVLQDDPFSGFSYDKINTEKGYTKLSFTTSEKENFYDTWTEDNFEELISDNPEEENKIREEYKPCLLLFLEV